MTVSTFRNYVLNLSLPYANRREIAQPSLSCPQGHQGYLNCVFCTQLLPVHQVPGHPSSLTEPAPRVFFCRCQQILPHQSQRSKFARDEPCWLYLSEQEQLDFWPSPWKLL